MKTTTVPIDYSDVTPQDFNHYFADTLAVWSFRDKRRLFMITGIEAGPTGNTIYGQYLTKNKEFKYKHLRFDKDWNTNLRPILSRAITFNFFDTAACFCPNRAK